MAKIDDEKVKEAAEAMKKVFEAEEMRKIEGPISPEGIVMLFLIAIPLDIAGIIFTILDIAYGIGEIFSWISDGFGIVIFGIWILIRWQTINQQREMVSKVVEKHRAVRKAVKAARGFSRGLRFGLAVVGEILPVIGFLPFWTWFVWSELRS
jgi:uncharacterized membrane protein